MPEEDALGADTEMPWRKPWELLRSGEIERGLEMLRREYEAKPKGAREILRLGIGYMWAQKYESAATHFTVATRREWNGEDDFAFAGVAEWQLGNYAAAIQRWREGLKAQYAVGCRVCSMTARFLVVVSALEPERFPKHEAEGALRDATEQIDPSRWSGLLGRYLLGQIEASEVEYWISDKNRDVEVQWRLLWQTDFYRSVRRLRHEEINAQTFRTQMRPMADSANSETIDTAAFAQLLRMPEFFFARTEAAKN